MAEKKLQGGSEEPLAPHKIGEWAGGLVDPYDVSECCRFYDFQSEEADRIHQDLSNGVLQLDDEYVNLTIQNMYVAIGVYDKWWNDIHEDL